MSATPSPQERPLPRERRERPILFSGPMVRAILDGRKTQTRRVVTGYEIRGPHPPGLFGVYRPKGPGSGWCAAFKPGDSARSSAAILCPYGIRGERLWVRETWRVRADLDHVKPSDLAPCEPWYCATGNGYGDEEPSGCAGGLGRKRPAIHMSRWASRLLLEITEVRVERLQDISEEDARAEGVAPYKLIEGDGGAQEGPAWNRIQFSHGWDALNKKRGFGWATNPWVWALSFRRVEASA